MNEKEASSQGLQFQGATARYPNEVEELKKRAAEIRKIGFRAVVVQSGTHEWGGGCKLLYVDPLYLTYAWLESIKTIRPNHLIKEASEKCKGIMSEAKAQQEKWDLSVVDAKLRVQTRLDKNNLK